MEGGAPSGTLTQLSKPASSMESLSISPSTYIQNPQEESIQIRILKLKIQNLLTSNVYFPVMQSYNNDVGLIFNIIKPIKYLLSTCFLSYRENIYITFLY